MKYIKYNKYSRYLLMSNTLFYLDGAYNRRPVDQSSLNLAPTISSIFQSAFSRATSPSVLSFPLLGRNNSQKILTNLSVVQSRRHRWMSAGARRAEAPTSSSSSSPSNSTGTGTRLSVSTLAGLVAAGFAVFVIGIWITVVLVRRKRRRQRFVARRKGSTERSSLEEAKRRPPNIQVNSVVLATPLGTGHAKTPGSAERGGRMNSPNDIRLPPITRMESATSFRTSEDYKFDPFVAIYIHINGIC